VWDSAKGVKLPPVNCLVAHGGQRAISGQEFRNGNAVDGHTLGKAVDDRRAAQVRIVDLKPGKVRVAHAPAGEVRVFKLRAGEVDILEGRAGEIDVCEARPGQIRLFRLDKPLSAVHLNRLFRIHPQTPNVLDVPRQRTSASKKSTTDSVIFAHASQNLNNLRTIESYERSLYIETMNALPNLFGQFFSPSAQAPDEGLTETQEEQLSARQTMQRDAVHQMIEQHSRLVYRVAFAVVRNAADAEDVVQETFLQLLRSSSDKIRKVAIEDEPGYLARVAWRLSVRRNVRPKAEARSAEILLEQPCPGKTPEQAALDSDLEAWLHLQIDELPEKLRQPLALAALGQLTSPQIAAILGIPEGSVRRRIHTAIQILRRQMEKQKGGSK